MSHCQHDVEVYLPVGEDTHFICSGVLNIPMPWFTPRPGQKAYPLLTGWEASYLPCALRCDCPGKLVSKIARCAAEGKSRSTGLCPPERSAGPGSDAACCVLRHSQEEGKLG